MTKSALLLLASALFLQGCSYLDRYNPGEAIMKKLQPTVNVNVNMNVDMACMQNIDSGKMEALQKRGEQMKSEIDALCKSGQRDAAQKKAIAFAKEINDAEVMKQFRECSKNSGMQAALVPGTENFSNDSPDKTHVCDY